MCFNQDDEEEKQHEVRQMQKIYSNEYCTIALVPELDSTPIYFIINFLTSQWMKRIRTLEETVMSSRMIFADRSIHSWWYCVSNSTIFHKQVDCDIGPILHYAHKLPAPKSMTTYSRLPTFFLML